MSRRTLTVMALAALAVGAAATRDPDDRAAPRDRRPPVTPTARATPAPPHGHDPAAALAAAYAALARTWTASSYLQTWRRELARTAGAYHRQLLTVRPTREQLAGLRADRASSHATVLAIHRRAAAADGPVRVVVELDERIRADAQQLSADTRNQVELERRRGGWRVTGFTVLLPSGPDR